MTGHLERASQSPSRSSQDSLLPQRVGAHSPVVLVQIPKKNFFFWGRGCFFALFLSTSSTPSYEGDFKQENYLMSLPAGLNF